MINLIPIAAMDFPEAMVAGLGVVLLFGSPIVYALLRHQQRMAELFRGERQGHSDIHALTEQVNRLTHVVHQNTLQIDELKSQLIARTPAPETIENRLSSS